SSLPGWRAQRHVLEGIWNERAGVGLVDVAGRTEISTRGNVGEHLPVAVHEMRHADHRRAGSLGILPTVTIEAAIRPYGELVIVDRMRDYRWLLGIVPHHALVVGDWPGEWRGGLVDHRRGISRQSRHELGRRLRIDRAARKHQGPSGKCARDGFQ